MGAIRLYEAAQPGDDEEMADALVTLNPGNPASVEAAQRAIEARFGVDVGPLLGAPRASWWARLFGRKPRPLPRLHYAPHIRAILPG